MPISDLFGLLQKRQTTPDKYLASSVNIVSGGQHGAQRAPFSPYSGVRAFRSWVYAAASINANAVAALPLRLYAKKDATPLPTRSIPRGRKAYMMGDLSGDARPSASVMRKAVAYGDDFEEVTGSHPITDLLCSSESVPQRLRPLGAADPLRRAHRQRLPASDHRRGVRPAGGDLAAGSALRRGHPGRRRVHPGLLSTAWTRSTSRSSSRTR
jgi:hypothetical protein